MKINLADTDTSIEAQQFIISTELLVVSTALVSLEVDGSIVWTISLTREDKCENCLLFICTFETVISSIIDAKSRCLGCFCSAPPRDHLSITCQSISVDGCFPFHSTAVLRAANVKAFVQYLSVFFHSLFKHSVLLLSC